MKRLLLLLIACAVGILCLSRAFSMAVASGVVRDAAGRAIPNAVVRVKGSAIQTPTDSEGRFTLSGFTPASRVHLTAWQKDFYIGGADAWPWRSRVEIRLARLSPRDHGDYQWVPPSVERSAVTGRLIRTTLDLAGRFAPETGVSAAERVFTLGCRDCHDTIYRQWTGSAHAGSAANPRFLTLYNGTDLHGARSPSTRYSNDREYGRVPLPPDPAAHDYGPGFKLDYPDSAGTCATCHLPGTALDRPFDSDPNRLTGASPVRSVHCDFCHKAQGIALDAATHLPADNMPGVLSMRLVRPAKGSQLFFGPFDDVDGRRDTRAPVMQQSEMCAPCHQATFWGVPIYESFAEWRSSPYPDEGKTCQSCHMRPDGVTKNIAPHRGGIERSADSVATHHLPGASSTALLQTAATLRMSAESTPDGFRVEVAVTNTGAGHKLPTDSPLREVLLVVTASDSSGAPVPLADGPTLPVWTGDLSGRPGVYFAKLLEQRWTSVVPSVAFWTHTRIVEDTRLAPRASVTRAFDFKTRDAGDVTITARLILRRAPFEMMRQKSWQVPDIEMNREEIKIRTS